MFFKKILFFCVLVPVNLYSIHVISADLGTVTHIFQPRATYVKGEFEHGRDDKGFLFTAPYSGTQAPQPQSVEICKQQKFHEFPQENILTKDALLAELFGLDGRKKVTHTHKWPYRTFGQISMIFGDTEYGGSGFMVGPHHFLTAAHNIYGKDKGGWPAQVFVRLALNGVAMPFGEVRATKIYTFKQYTDHEDPNFDLALVILEKSVGHQTGWCGLMSAPDAKLVQESINVTGYPGDKNLIEMWGMGYVLHQVQKERLFYEIDTYPGQSGSAIWVHKWGHPYVIGVHTHGEGGAEVGNSGVRLSKEKFNKIVAEWIPETLELGPPGMTPQEISLLQKRKAQKENRLKAVMQQRSIGDNGQAARERMFAAMRADHAWVMAHIHYCNRPPAPEHITRELAESERAVGEINARWLALGQEEMRLKKELKEIEEQLAKIQF